MTYIISPWYMGKTSHKSTKTTFSKTNIIFTGDKRTHTVSMASLGWTLGLASCQQELIPSPIWTQTVENNLHRFSGWIVFLSTNWQCKITECHIDRNFCDRCSYRMIYENEASNTNATIPCARWSLQQDQTEATSPDLSHNLTLKKRSVNCVPSLTYETILQNDKWQRVARHIADKDFGQWLTVTDLQDIAIPQE